MKKTLITAAVAVAIGQPLSALAVDSADQFNDTNNTDVSVNGPVAAGDGSIATNEFSNANNVATVGSYSPVLNDSFNDINSDNAVDIAEDGVLIFGDNVNQAVASSDLKASISGNHLYVNSAAGNVAQALASNGGPTAKKRESFNKISGSFSGASGITVASQNNGHAAVIEQSVVVQSNFSLN